MSEKTDMQVEDLSAVAHAPAEPESAKVEGTGPVTDFAQIRDRAIRLFTYLKELCMLRTTQVRTAASYDQVFWINDLPRDKLCQCVAWNINDVQQVNR